MKTEYKIKAGTQSGEWTTDIQFLRENYRRDGNTLWRRETETPEEAAVRRWSVVEKYERQEVESRRFLEALHNWTDRLSPPPTATECQVDWDTLEPVEEVPVWQFSFAPFLWVAGVDSKTYHKETDTETLNRMAYGKSAYGHTRESALRNLAELQSIQK